MPSDNHPLYVSRELVRQLREDPIASGQILEYITIDELLILCNVKHEVIRNYLERHAPPDVEVIK